MSRHSILLCVAALVCLLVSIAARAENAAPAAPAALENEFVRVVVNPGPNEMGRFSMTTTGGDPSRPQSKDKRMIFGGNKPWTSYTTVRIDGESYIVGGPTKKRAGRAAKYGDPAQPPVLADNRITYRQQFGDIEVTQEMAFVRGMSTRMLDTVGITYSFTNRGTVNHQVGLRILLDTMCGDNDGAPIRAGRNAIISAISLAGKEVPDFWQAFDSLASPTVISQGSLRGPNITPPDKVLFADWGTFADEAWEPTLTAGQGFIRTGETDPDTAVAMLWNPVNLEPGKTVSRVSNYGIGEVSLKPGQLTLGLTAPAETTYEHERTHSITLASYLQNVGGFTAHDVTMTLEVPEGLKVLDGDSLQSTEKALSPNETLQKSWSMVPDGKIAGKVTLKLTVTSSNIEGNNITRDITIFVPKPRMNFLPSASKVRPDPDIPSPVVMELNMAPADDFIGASVTIAFDPNVVKPLDVSRGRAFLDGGHRYYWRVDKTQAAKGVLVLTGRRIDAQNEPAEPLTQAEINLATIIFRTVKPGKTALTITKAVLINQAGEEQSIEFTNGEITVIGDDTPSTGSHGTP